MSETPREVITFAPPGGVFHKADFPWLTAIRACVRGGDGGDGPYGEPGGQGETRFISLPADEVPSELRIAVARGGRGSPGARDGEDGFVLIELFD